MKVSTNHKMCRLQSCQFLQTYDLQSIFVRNRRITPGGRKYMYEGCPKRSCNSFQSEKRRYLRKVSYYLNIDLKNACLKTYKNAHYYIGVIVFNTLSLKAQSKLSYNKVFITP